MENTEEYTITIEQLLETYDLLDELIIKTNKETYLLGLEDKNPELCLMQKHLHIVLQ